MEIAIGVVAALLAGAVGFAVGRKGGGSAGHEAGRGEGHAEGLAQGRAEGDARLRAAADAIARGRIPEGAAPGSAEAALHRALASGWAPRDKERQRALEEAVGRVAGFLDRSVRAPLAGASPASSNDELRSRIARALGSLEDLGFFVQEMPSSREGRDLQALVQQVTREFAQDQSATLRVRLDERPVRAQVNPQAFMDTLYLLLHNAARFGGAGTVDVTVLNEGGRAVVRVRDRGPGFSEEAFARAFDPFYSTAADGLGLGLPHARKTVEAMGGRIELRNVPDGGAEVAVTLPAA